MDRARVCLNEIVDMYVSGPDANSPDLLERVADLFFVTSEKQTEQDRKTFGDVMERMAYAADPITRAIFSERIAQASKAPVDLIIRLAQDEIFIARPVLQYSESLHEGNLVSLLHKTEQGHLKATAHRKRLTKPVTDIIVKRGDLDVLQAVVGNTGAEFSPEAMDQLSRAGEIHGDLQSMLDMRRNLNPRAITKLKRLTEVNFWQQMAETMLMTSEKLDTKNAPKPKSVSTPSKNNAPEQKEDQAAKPQKNGKIKAVNAVSENVLVEHARASEVDKTMMAFASITELDMTMVEHCLFQAHISALMVLCKAHGLAPGTFTALLQIRETVTNAPTEDTIGLMRRYENMTAETAKRIINFSDKQPKESNKKQEQASA